MAQLLNTYRRWRSLPKWEYRIEQSEYGTYVTNGASFESRITDELGRWGWELVAVVVQPFNQHVLHYFKRRIR